MAKLLRKREYVREGRNGYHGIDEMRGGRCIRTVVSLKVKRDAELVAGELDNVYHYGLMDAHVGLRLPLLADVREDSNGQVVPKGTMVRVLDWCPAGFTVEVSPDHVVGFVELTKAKYVPLEALREVTS